MIDDNRNDPAPSDEAARPAWERPELRRLSVEEAEGAAGFGGDNGAFS